MSTIYALASGGLPAGIGVIRLSGPQAAVAVMALTGKPVPDARQAVLRRFHNPGTGEVLDHGLLLWFPAPHSFTGEDVAELHLHGGRAVVAAVLNVLSGVPDTRPAEAGEFTRRAFEAGKLDLTAVEGLADLVAAETEAQRKQALKQYDGALAGLYDGWRQQLVRQLAWLEADLDFVEEEDIPDNVVSTILPQLDVLREEITAHLSDNRAGERLREGLTVVVTGPPNSGKSSIINKIAKRDVAIVTDIAGTTRDVIEVHLDLGGYPVTMVDTAGLRETADAIEAEGVRRARARAANADIQLFVVDGTEMQRMARLDVPEGAWLVLNKLDLKPDMQAPKDGFVLSASTGEGLDALLQAIERYLGKVFARSGAPVLTRQRHRSALQDCVAHLEKALAATQETPPELVAEDVRLAMRALARITGRVDVEDLLDVIFRDFCIGK